MSAPKATSQSETAARRAPVTLRDVARRANVSQATAARAMGGYGYVSANRRRRVDRNRLGDGVNRDLIGLVAARKGDQGEASADESHAGGQPG